MGPDFPLMLDCYTALDVEYTADLAHRLSSCNLTWIEEPLMPDDYAGHAKLGRRFESMRTQASVCCSRMLCGWVAQPSVALATAQSVALVPHGCGVYGYYMAMAFEHIRLAEFMMMSERADMFEPNFGKIFKSESLPDRGYVELPTTPGFGLELNRDEVNLIRPYDRSGVQ